MQLLDGVIFAADWELHVIKRGKNPRPVMRRRRANGTPEYMEIDEYNRRHEHLKSDAQRMLDDVRTDLGDVATRGILHDALLDANRPEEAAKLTGLAGEAAVIHDNKVVTAQEVPTERQQAFINWELADRNYHLSRNVLMNPELIGWIPVNDPNTPVGTVVVNLHGQGVSRMLPIDAVIAGLRRLKASPPKAPDRRVSGRAMIGAMIGYIDDVAPDVPASLVATMSPSIVYGHATRSRSLYSVTDTDGTHYDYRDMPSGAGWRGHYGILTLPDGYVRRVTRSPEFLYPGHDELDTVMRSQGAPEEPHYAT